MKKTMVLRKNDSNYTYSLETIESIEMDCLCQRDVEKFLPGFAGKEDGTAINIDVELFPCTKEQAQKYEIIILKNSGYNDLEIRETTDEDGDGDDYPNHLADICSLSDERYGVLRELFSGIKESERYGLIVHY